MADAVVADPTSAPPSDGRRRIMDEAATLFLRQGYDGASLRHIAAACGMQAGSLYYHFASKNDLLEAVLRRGIEIMVDAFETAAAETRGAPARERLGRHIRAHLAALHENGPYTAVHVTAFRTAPDQVRDVIVPVRDSYEAMWTGLLTELVDDGDLDPSTPVGLTRLNLFASMNHSIEWFDHERGNLDELAEVIAHQLWQGVAA